MKSGMFAFYSIAFFWVLIRGLDSSSTIRQDRKFISVKTGDSRTLRCFYDKKFFENLFWFKQALGQKLQLISSFTKYNENTTIHGEFKNRFQVTLNSRDGQNHLNIIDLHVSDSATYHCAMQVYNKLEFGEGIYISVEDPSSELRPLINQPETNLIPVGGSSTLNCIVHTGICDGEHSVYWFKDAGESHSGLIYTHGGRNDQCERNSSTKTQSCIYNLNISDGGTYYCAVASCGQILIGNGTQISYESIIPHLERGALVLTTFLSVFQAVLLCMIIKTNGLRDKGFFGRFSRPSQIATKIEQHEENVNYAALTPHWENRSRRQRTDNKSVYSAVKP